DRDAGVLHDVVDQPAGDGHGVELQLGENLGDLDAVGDERLAGETLLAAMRLFAEAIGAREQVAVETIRLERARPARNQLVERRCRHNSPASAKLVYRPRPMIT